MEKYKLAIVGASGLVGHTILKVLEERNLPILKYVLFASKKSAGKKINFMNKEYVINELNENSFDEGFDFAIFSAGSEVAKKYAPIAVSKNCIVIDNSNNFRMNKDVPLVVPEVNLNELKNHHGIIANPNCSTIQAVTVLKPLDDKYKIKRIVLSTYQAVSGAGRNGILDLKAGIQNYLTDFYYANEAGDDYLIPSNISTYNLEKFPYPIFSNAIPHIDVFFNNGYTKEEEKMINETKKILNNPDLKITATAVRVPVFNSHSESINIEFENNFSIDDLTNVLKNSPGIIVEDDILKNIYPTASNVSGKDEVFVGRIRKDFSIPSGVNLWVVADNLRKGAATNAVQILENLI